MRLRSVRREAGCPGNSRAAGRCFPAGRPVSSFHLIIESRYHADHCRARQGGFNDQRDMCNARPGAPLWKAPPATAWPMLLTAVLDVAADEFLGVFFEHAIDLVQQGVELGDDLLALCSEAILFGGIAVALHGSRRLSLPRL